MARRKRKEDDIRAASVSLEDWCDPDLRLPTDYVWEDSPPGSGWLRAKPLKIRHASRLVQHVDAEIRAAVAVAAPQLRALRDAKSGAGSRADHVTEK